MSIPGTDIPATGAHAGPTVFVSYRRSDSPSAARQIADALKGRFGARQRVLRHAGPAAGHRLAPGHRGSRPGGRRHRGGDRAAVGGDRRRARPAPGAAARGGGRRPHGDRGGAARRRPGGARAGGRAALPARDALPRPFRPITSLNAVALRHASWDRDLEALVVALAAPARRPRPPQPATAERRGAGRNGSRRPAARPRVTTAGSRRRCRGASWSRCSAPASTSPPTRRSGSGLRAAPDAAELARRWPSASRCESGSADLAGGRAAGAGGRGAQAARAGAARAAARRDPVEPGPVHDALARLPALLRAAELRELPLLVTTTYDTALERRSSAPRAVRPGGLHRRRQARGRFLHIPWYDAEDRAIEPIARPNEYVEFPIDDYGDLSRTDHHEGPRRRGARRSARPAGADRLHRHRGRLHRLPEREPGREPRPDPAAHQAARQPLPVPGLRRPRVEPAGLPAPRVARGRAGRDVVGGAGGRRRGRRRLLADAGGRALRPVAGRLPGRPRAVPRAGDRRPSLRRAGALRRGGRRPVLRTRRGAQADHRQPAGIAVHVAVRAQRRRQELAAACRGRGAARRRARLAARPVHLQQLERRPATSSCRARSEPAARASRRRSRPGPPRSTARCS